MNLGLAIMLGGSAVWYYHSSRAGVRPAVVVGGRYVATYSLPPSFPSDENSLGRLQAILPEGSSLEVDGRLLVVTLTAVSSRPIGDIPTPLGTVKLVSLRRLSDVVSGARPEEKLPTTLSSWTRRDGIGYVWNGWTAAKPMSLTQVNSMIARLPVELQFPEVWRHNGKIWVRIY